MSKHLAPNGNPSNLNPEQYRLVRTPAFKEWFGDWEKLILTKINDSGIDEISLKRLEDGVSKIVDENSEPLVVYRGDDKERGNIFITGETAFRGSTGNFNLKSFYFTDSYESAKSFGKIVKSYFINSKINLDLRVYFKDVVTSESELKKYLDKTKIKNTLSDDNVKYHLWGLVKYFEDGLYEKYSGFWFKDSSVTKGQNSLVVFNPNQIKLADGSNTTFDGKNPDIRFEEGGELNKNVLYVKSYTNKFNQNVCFIKFSIDSMKHIFISKEIKINKNNFYNYTICNWRKVESMDFISDYMSDSGSEYMYSKEGVYRRSNHWGCNVATCIWLLNGDYLFSNSTTIGFAKYDDFFTYYKDYNQNTQLDKKESMITKDLLKKSICENEFVIKNRIKNRLKIKPYIEKNIDLGKRVSLKNINIELENTMTYNKGGRTIAQTPAPKKDQIKGSDKNKEGSSKDLTSAKKIELSDSTIEAIKNKVDKHNEKHPKKKITIDSAKAVVRRGMGAYSSSYRPTISGGKPNSRVAWGLARLNAFLYKIVNGKSKSGKYSQDNDLIKELGYKVQKYADGGLVGNVFTEIIYRAILSTETTTDIYAKGNDLDKIKSEYDSISAVDFDNPNSNGNSKILDSIINKYEFIGDDTLNAEDYIDDLQNTDFWNLIEEDFDEIEFDSVDAINKSTDEMIDEIREFIKQEYNIGGRYASKYMTISVDDDNEDFIADLNIRTADHSQNYRNNSGNSYNLSFVIANKNATEQRFIPLGDEYYYKYIVDIEDLKEEIKGIIDEKIEYIKEKEGRKYSDGGETDELNLIKNKDMTNSNPKDEVTFNIPLLIRYSELMREDIKTDVALHEIVENLLEIKDKGTLTMEDYESIVGNVTGSEENTEEEKMEEGGKVESIKSKKGDIKISLDENWYSDDTDVELVPVSELIKFREFDRKVSPKYNKDNSVDNINHLKFMFQKDGVKEPLIIEYSKEDNAVLIIEGNHRINSAIDLGMEYLPARVVLKKYSKFSPSQLKNAMKVSGVTADESGYISSNLKPSRVGIEGTMPIYADGGIIEGRLHSECDVNEGCGRKFQVGENGHIIEAERDEAVIVANAFESNEELTIKGTPSEVASALNVLGGGKNFDKGAEIIKNGQELEIPELEKEATDTDVADVIDSGSIIINRRSMADEKEYEVTGTPKQIASAINSIDGNGVVIENGAEIKEN